VKLQIVQGGRHFRRSVMALGALAFACFLVALVQANRGAVYYSDYVGASVSCINQAIGAEPVSVECSQSPAVLEPLVAHRRAYAIGELFLNMGLALSVLVVMSAGLRLLRRRALPPDRPLPVSGAAGNAA
jgi:hypothetical protein